MTPLGATRGLMNARGDRAAPHRFERGARFARGEPAPPDAFAPGTSANGHYGATIGLRWAIAD